MRKSWLITGAVIAVAVLGLAWNLLRPGAAVEVVHPRTGVLRAFVEEQAVTELPNDYLIAMPIAGWLEPIALREGDPVKQGEIVARLETSDLLDRVKQAEQRIAVLETKLRQTADHRLERNALVHANASVKALDETVAASEKKLESSEAVMEFAKSELDRLRGLTERDVTAQRELRVAEMEWRKAWGDYQSDALNLAALKTIAAVSYIGPKFINDYIDRKTFDLESTQQQLEEARAALDIEKRNLERAQITAPIDGVVLERHQTRRQYLSAGTALLTLGRLDDLEVIAEVLTERATRIKPGDPVDVFGDAIPEGSIRGTVTRVYPAGFKKISSLGVEQQRVNVAVKLEHRPERLGVAFRVNVRIVYAEAPDALILPRTALYRGPRGGWRVLVVEGGRTREQAVELGLTNDDEAQVVSGLTAASTVIAKPSRDIRPGMRVQPRE